jgi:transposase, IS5 family
MLIDRYPPMNLFALASDLATGFEPVLRELDRLLEDKVILQAIKADMARRSRRSLTAGRPGTPVEVIVRLLVVKRLYGWSYEELEHFVGDSLVLRQFCRIYQEKVPADTTLLRWAGVIAPATLGVLNERVVALARDLQVTAGDKLRLDSTVVETTIHHPSDSGLLNDGVRVLGRLMRRAKAVLGTTVDLGKRAFQAHTRSARDLVQRLHRLGRRKGDEAAGALRVAYGRLINVARKTRRQAARVAAALRLRTEPAARRLADHIEPILPRLDRVLAQTERRVVHGEAVPAGTRSSACSSRIPRSSSATRPASPWSSGARCGWKRSRAVSSAAGACLIRRVRTPPIWCQAWRRTWCDSASLPGWWRPTAVFSRGTTRPRPDRRVFGTWLFRQPVR